MAEFLFANIQEKDLEELDQIVTRQQFIGLDNLSAEDEMQFHSKIYEIAGNDFILQLDTIMHPIFAFAKQNYKNHFLPIDKQLVERGEQVTHADLLSFIKKGDKTGYQEAIKKHLEPYWDFIYNYELQ